jgi:hypothetical protein
MKDNEDITDLVFPYLIGNNTVILETRYLLISIGNNSCSGSEETELDNILIIIGGNIFIRKRLRFQKFIFRINTV